MQSLSQIITLCIKNEPSFFFKLQSERAVSDQLLRCIEYQMIHNEGQDIIALKMLYKILLKGIIASDKFFENFVDRDDFFNKLVVRPLNDIALSLQNPPNDNQSEVIKRARIFLTILMVWMAKTPIIRNIHVFTLTILDNPEIVNLIQSFCHFEVE